MVCAVHAGTLVAGPGSKAYCKSCCGQVPVRVVDSVQAVCMKGHIVLDLEADEDTSLPSSSKQLASLVMLCMLI